jgi:hypothetical protein
MTTRELTQRENKILELTTEIWNLTVGNGILGPEVAGRKARNREILDTMRFHIHGIQTLIFAQPLIDAQYP